MIVRSAGFELRPACDADRDAIAEIWRAGAGLPGVGPAIMPSPADFRQRVDAEFRAGWVVTLAIGDAGILGFLAVRPETRVLAELLVRPDAIGKGIGQALLAEAMRRMPEGFTLYTRSANAAARRFYERNGLQAVREDVHPRFGDVIVHYEWRPGGR